MDAGKISSAISRCRDFHGIVPREAHGPSTPSMSAGALAVAVWMPCRRTPRSV